MLKKSLIITNKLGLHARAAAKLVNEANHFASEIIITCNNKQANGKSIMGVMMLAARKGTAIDLSINGDDEEAALIALENLINNKFGEPC